MLLNETCFRSNARAFGLSYTRCGEIAKGKKLLNYM